MQYISLKVHKVEFPGFLLSRLYSKGTLIIMKLYSHLTAYILNRKWFNFSLEFFYQCMLTNAALQITQKTQSERRTNFNTSESSIDHEIWRTGSAHFMLSATDVIS